MGFLSSKNDLGQTTEFFLRVKFLKPSIADKGQTVENKLLYEHQL